MILVSVDMNCRSRSVDSLEKTSDNFGLLTGSLLSDVLKLSLNRGIGLFLSL